MNVMPVGELRLSISPTVVVLKSANDITSTL